MGGKFESFGFKISKSYFSLIFISFRKLKEVLKGLKYLKENRVLNHDLLTLHFQDNFSLSVSFRFTSKVGF